jgi:2,3-bisphosphoglycerate-independent phosphoglycerate mutase
VTVAITEGERSTEFDSLVGGIVPAKDDRINRVYIPSPAAEWLDLQPESRSFTITDRVLIHLASKRYAALVINLPAADMTASTGDISKTIEAVQFIDTCLGGIVDGIRQAGGAAVITSSHGNCEELCDPASGTPIYMSSTNPVPLHLIDDQTPGIGLAEGGSLRDVASTLLGVMGIDPPDEMTGRDLRIK